MLIIPRWIGKVQVRAVGLQGEDIWVRWLGQRSASDVPQFSCPKHGGLRAAVTLLWHAALCHSHPNLARGIDVFALQWGPSRLDGRAMV